MKEKQAIKYLESLNQWAHLKGYTVSYSYNAEDEVSFENKTITISSRTNPEKMLYSLLHECGHLLEYNNNSDSYHKKYPLAKTIMCDGRTRHSNQGRVETIEEEINAWKKGEKLADRLGFKMNKKVYRKYAADNVITYIDWAAAR